MISINKYDNLTKLFTNKVNKRTKEIQDTLIEKYNEDAKYVPDTLEYRIGFKHGMEEALSMFSLVSHDALFNEKE